MLTPHLLHVFSTFTTGGPQVRTCDILNHFGSDYRHTILAMDGNIAARDRLDKSLDVAFPQPAIRKKDTLRNPFRFRGLLDEYKPDLLLTYNWGTIEWAMANCAFPKCDHIHMEEGFGPDEAHGQKSVRVWFRRIFLSRTTKVLVPSLNLRRLATETWRLRPSLVEYVPNGVDLAHYARAKTAAVPGKDASLRVVGTVATLRKEKNIPRMLEAFRRLPKADNARLRIAGGGPELGTLTALAAREGLSDRVEFLGYRADPAPVMAGLDVFCISSDTEQMPLSVLEAMAAGLPVAGTDVGDIKDMVAEENRPFITPKDDPAALTESLRRLCADADLAARIGEANLRKCRETFDKQAMYARYQGLYREAMGR